MTTPASPEPAPTAPAEPKPCQITCPICRGPGIERKQKWHCAKCGQLLQTCCD